MSKATRAPHAPVPPRTHSRTRTAPSTPPWGLSSVWGCPGPRRPVCTHGWLWLLPWAPVQAPLLPRPVLPIQLKLIGGDLLAVCRLQSHAGQSADHGNWNILGNCTRQQQHSTAQPATLPRAGPPACARPGLPHSPLPSGPTNVRLCPAPSRVSRHHLPLTLPILPLCYPSQ